MRVRDEGFRLMTGSMHFQGAGFRSSGHVGI